jgi:hypothetical protein
VSVNLQPEVAGRPLTRSVNPLIELNSPSTNSKWDGQFTDTAQKTLIDGRVWTDHLTTNQTDCALWD